jgi:hypothetical protein
MTDKEEHIKTKVEILKIELKKFIRFFEKGLEYDKMIYTYWNAKDILLFGTRVLQGIFRI